MKTYIRARIKWLPSRYEKYYTRKIIYPGLRETIFIPNPFPKNSNPHYHTLLLNTYMTPLRESLTEELFSTLAILGESRIMETAQRRPEESAISMLLIILSRLTLFSPYEPIKRRGSFTI